jgi:phasin family protein
MFKFEEAGLFGKDAMDKALKSYSTTSKGLQAIATEATDYAKKSFEASFQHMQTLMGVRSFEAAIELQTAYTRTAMEGYVAEMTKLGEMYADLAKEIYEPAKAATASEAVRVKGEKAAAAAA